MKRLRIAAADWSDTCCAVIEVTSASNGSTCSGGRKPASPVASRARVSSLCRPGVEAVEIERQPEEVEHLRLDRLVVRGDVDAAGRSLDPHLPAGEDTMDAAFAPEGCAVEAVHVEAGGRELEVVRLGQANEHVREGCQSRL